MTEPCRQQLEDAGQVQLGGMMLEQIDPLADRLQHSELDAVVYQLGEVTRAGRPRMHISPGHGERLQDRRNPRDRLRLAAGHEAGTSPGAVDPTGGADVQQMDTSLEQPGLPADGVAPIGITAVHHDVVGLESGCERVENLVHRRAGGNVQEAPPVGG